MSNAHVAKTGLEHLVLDAVDLHVRALQHEIERLLAASAHDADFDLRSHLAAHAVDGVVQARRFHRHIVDAHDDVAWQDSRARGRCALDRCYHLDRAVLHGDFDADAGIVAGGTDADLVIFVGVEERQCG
jgi:hypothetical protein